MDTPTACYEVLAHHGRTFALASRLLSKDQREDAAVLYAFCRYVDDVADDTPDRVQARKELLEVRRELEGGVERRPIVALFADVARRRGIDVRTADYLVQAVLSDLDTVRCQNDQQLLRYCYGVAGTVGLMMCGVLGVRSNEALHFAIDLGVGMQLTNICRDIREDGLRNRCYIPRDRLEKRGIGQEQVVSQTCDPEELAVVTKDLLELAERYYESADRGMQAIPMPGRAAIIVAARVYRAIGFRLRRVHRGDALHGRTIVPMSHRIFLASLSLIEVLHPKFWFGRLGAHEHGLHRPLQGLPGASFHG